MIDARSDVKQTSLCPDINSLSLLFGFFKLIIALAVIAFYCFLSVTNEDHATHTVVLIYAIIIDCVAIGIFLAGYFGNNFIYLSWYYVMAYIVAAMKLAIIFIFIYYALALLVAPYASMIVADIIMLFLMRSEIKAHKRKNRPQIEFVNNLTNYNDMFRITIPNQLAENVEAPGPKKADDNKQEQNFEFAEAGIIATDTFVYM